MNNNLRTWFWSGGYRFFRFLQHALILSCFAIPLLYVAFIPVFRVFPRPQLNDVVTKAPHIFVLVEGRGGGGGVGGGVRITVGGGVRITVGVGACITVGVGVVACVLAGACVAAGCTIFS
jgi:hypothetical protein